jgi:hypothetical protein
MALILYVVRPWPDGRMFGSFFFVIGLSNMVTCRTNGRKLFAKTQASSPFVARIWAVAGEKGVQALILGMGIILTLAGAALIAPRLA